MKRQSPRDRHFDELLDAAALLDEEDRWIGLYVEQLRCALGPLKQPDPVVEHPGPALCAKGYRVPALAQQRRLDGDAYQLLFASGRIDQADVSRTGLEKHRPGGLVDFHAESRRLAGVRIDQIYQQLVTAGRLIGQLEFDGEGVLASSSPRVCRAGVNPREVLGRVAPADNETNVLRKEPAVGLDPSGAGELPPAVVGSPDLPDAFVRLGGSGRRERDQKGPRVAPCRSGAHDLEAQRRWGTIARLAARQRRLVGPKEIPSMIGALGASSMPQGGLSGPAVDGREGMRGMGRLGWPGPCPGVVPGAG